ncbi:MAG: cytochrome c oxidase subunit II [Anaerolineaceae bacterium]|jgi:cytochrome c oxidase subunit 2
MTGRKLAGFTIGLLGTLILVGCSGTSSILFPASPNARATAQLFNFVSIIEAIVFVIVETALVYAVVHFSRKQSSGLPKQIEGNLTLEIVWTVIPSIILALIFFVSLGTLRFVTSAPPQSFLTNAPIHVRVIGHQWFFEFDYPDLNIVTANQLVVPINTLVNVDVQSVDVIHSYWVPELGGKIDAIPGITNQLHFQAEKLGVFAGQCAEFCGADHAQMRLTVVVKTPEEYAAWVKGQQAPIPLLSGDASLGEQVFMGGACLGCHTIDNTKAQGKVGPNLTHFASRDLFAGSILANTTDNVSQWLVDPQAIKMGNLMPNLHLPNNNIKLLVSFLESLK